jgi:subtilisin-like proprotein convertase family protein
MKTLLGPVMACALLFWAPPPSGASVPAVMPAQGVVYDNAGAPFTGTVAMTFALHDAAAGGSPLWLETWPPDAHECQADPAGCVEVEQGVFAVMLGTHVPLTPAVFASAPGLWLGIAVEAESELPRQPLGTSAYAFHAASAEVAATLACSGCIPPEWLSPEAIAAFGGPITAADLPADGLDEVSGGTLTNAFSASWGLGNPPVTITDYWPSGVDATLLIADSGKLVSIAVHVAVDHPDPSQLLLTLVAPDGTTLLLHNMTAGDPGGLDRTWPPASVSMGALSQLVGKDPGGTWTLHAEDAVFSNGVAGAIVAFEIAYEVLRDAEVGVNGALKVSGDLTVDGAILGAGIGLGKAVAPGCGIDLSTEAGPVCVDGQPVLLVGTAASEAQMQALPASAAVVYRSDESRLWLHHSKGQWRRLLVDAVCGDGIVDPPEPCDDGNADSTDACVGCQPAKCGDEGVHQGVEECDDANTDPSDACLGCKLAVCGDGALQAGVDLCDGQALGGATCASVVGPGWTGTLACAASCNAYDTSSCVNPLGGQPDNPAPSCKQILDTGASVGDGIYHLTNGTKVFQAWCDMSGGGWTLVASWVYSVFPGDWGKFHYLATDPAPGKQHVLPFLSLFPSPAEVRLVYLDNGHGFTEAIKGGASWTTLASHGARIQVSTGDYLIFDDQGCSGGQGICVVNGTYGSGFNCDGDNNQVYGRGLFNSCASNELGCANCNVFAPAWKVDTSSCTVDVCNAMGHVAVYMR